MVKAVFDEMSRESPRRRFTVGIRDDVSNSSLSFDASFDIEPDDLSRAIFYGLGSDGTVSANKATIKIIGEEAPLFAQGHFEYDSRKAGSTTVSHLRFGRARSRSVSWKRARGCSPSTPTRSQKRRARFRMVELRSPERYRMLVNAARDAIRQRRALYEQLARIHLPKESQHG